jgi:hypothetical protein
MVGVRTTNFRNLALFTGGFAGALVLITMASGTVSVEQELIQANAGQSYSLTLNGSNTFSGLTSSYATTALSKTSSYVDFSALGIKSLSGGVGTLQSGTSANNYLFNSTPITGVTSIVVAYSGGDALSVYSGATVGALTSKIFTFSNTASRLTLPDSGYKYFSFVNESGSAINLTSITYNYKCAAGTDTVGIDSLTLSPTSKSLSVGETVALTPTISPSTAPNQNVVYESSDTSVASVSSAGVVTAVGAGSATINCYSYVDNSKTASCALTVVQASSLTIDNVTVTVNGTANLNVTYTNISDASSGLTFTNGTYNMYQGYSNCIITGNYTTGYQVEGLKAGTTTTITATTASGVSTTFTVTIADDYYNDDDARDGLRQRILSVGSTTSTPTFCGAPLTGAT